MSSKKVLFIILSDQPIPNLLSVREFKPDIVYAIVTKEMEKKGIFEVFKDQLNNTVINKIEIDEDISNINNFKMSLKSSLESIYQENKNNEWVINITGGTKLMSVLVNSFFENKSMEHKIVYLPVNHNFFIDINKGDKIDVTYKLTVNEFFYVYGYECDGSQFRLDNEYSSISTYLAKNSDVESVYEFLSDIKKIEQSKKIKIDAPLVIDENNALSTENKELIDFITHSPFNLVSNNYDPFKMKHILTGKLSVKNKKFLTGGWLEYFMAYVIYNLKDKLNLYDLKVNLKITPKKIKSEEIINEIDVAFMYNQSLHIFECKTGYQKHDESGNEALYKIEAIKAGIGAIKSKIYLVTTSENILDNSNKIKDNIKNRASLYECTIINRHDVISLANEIENIDKLEEMMKKILKLY